MGRVLQDTFLLPFKSRSRATSPTLASHKKPLIGKARAESPTCRHSSFAAPDWDVLCIVTFSTRIIAENSVKSYRHPKLQTSANDVACSPHLAGGVAVDGVPWRRRRRRGAAHALLVAGCRVPGVQSSEVCRRSCLDTVSPKP